MTANPARLLHRHLGAITGIDQNVTWPVAWEQVTGGPWIGQVEGLLRVHSNLVRAVRRHPETDPGGALFHADAWRRAILLNDVRHDLAIRSSGFILDPGAVAALAPLKPLIDSWKDDVLLAAGDDTDRANLRNAAGKLRDAIIEVPDLDRSLANYLLDLVTQIESALDQWPVFEDVLLQEVAQQTIVSTTQHVNLLSRLKPFTAVGGP